MPNEMISTKKPWILAIFAIMIINTIVALGGLAGMATPLDLLSTGTSYIPAETGVVAQSATFSMAALMVLVLDIIMVWGITQGHTWVWWMLTFTSIFAVIFGLWGLVAGQPIAVVSFLVNAFLVAALLKREVISEFDPNLHIIPKTGIW